MSRCFTWFPISGLGEPNIYHNLANSTRMEFLLGGRFTKLDDCTTCVVEKVWE